MNTHRRKKSSMRQRLQGSRVIRGVTSYGVLIGVTLMISLPVFWFLLTSLKQDIEYLSYPIKILPKVPQWQNYTTIFTPKYNLLKYAGHSLFLAMTFSILTTLTSSMGGFAFSRFTDVPGLNRLFLIIIALLIIPGIVTLIPQFIIFARLRLTDTYWPWILWGLTASPYYIFLFRQFFLSFPKELEDAAEVDGCGPLRIFLQIFLPNAKPALATSLIFNFGGVWGDYYTPLIYLSDAKTTLAVKLSGSGLFRNPQGFPYITLTLAACVLYTLPLILTFFIGQKYILRGVVTSGLKG